MAVILFHLPTKYGSDCFRRKFIDHWERWWAYRREEIPADYFEQGHWRTEPEGDGPVLINLIHDIDNLHYICGDIEQIFAYSSSANHGFAVEDTAAFTFRFQQGALGSGLVCAIGEATPRSRSQRFVGCPADSLLPGDSKGR